MTDFALPAQGDPHPYVLEQAFASYRPRFRSLDDEPFELARHAEQWARKKLSPEDAGRITVQGLWAKADTRTMARRFVDIYLDAGRHDLLEAHCRPAEWGAELPWPEHHEILEKLIETGHERRAVRCWVHFVRKVGIQFWASVRDRDAARSREARGKPHPLGEFDAATAAEMLAHDKPVMIEAIDLAMPVIESHGTARDRDWLASMRAQVAAEQKEILKDRPDPAEMTEELFWQIIEAGGLTADERIEGLVERVAAYGPKAIKAFGQLLQDRLADAYREDIWALAYLLMDGCSDDAFDGFRNWLVLQGRAVWRAALADPDGFDTDLARGGAVAEALPELVAQAHELRSGKPMPRLKIAKPKIGELDEDAFPAMLPRVAAAVG